MALPECAIGNEPYTITWTDGEGDPGQSWGFTPAHACLNAGNGGSFSGNTCTFEDSWGGGTKAVAVQQVCWDSSNPDPATAMPGQTVNVAVTLTAEPPEFTQARAQADLIVWIAVMAFLALIWGAKQVGNLFRSGRSET